MKIVIAEPIADKLNQLIAEKQKDWQIYTDKPTNKHDYIKRLKGAEAATAYSLRFDEEVLAACPELKYLAIPAVGAGFFVDMSAAKKHNVTVMNCPGYNSTAVAELAIALAISINRNILQEHLDIREGKWNLDPLKGHLLRGRHIGLIGYGNIGRTIESMLKAWDSTFDYVNSTSSSEEVDSLMASADVVFICCALTPATEGLVSARRIGLMKSEAVLVNVSRAAVLDEDALYEAVKNNRIAGAGLDVFKDEPEFSRKVPEGIRRFAELPNVICTPHLAGTAFETQLTLGQMIFDDLESAERGKPINIYIG